MFINHILVISSALTLLAGTQNTITAPATTNTPATVTILTLKGIELLPLDPVEEAMQASTMSLYTEEPEPMSGQNLEEPDLTSSLWQKQLDHPYLTLATWLLVMVIGLKAFTRQPVVLPGAVFLAVGAAGLVLLPGWRHGLWLSVVLGAFPFIVRCRDLRDQAVLQWRFRG